MPTISCVITNFNKSQWLRTAIDSVLSQTMSVDELIVADDASTDSSRELIESFASRCRILNPIYRNRNLGGALNRDLAIRGSTGDLVTTLDGDDYYLPRKIEEEFLAIKDLSKGIAFSDFVVEDHILQSRTSSSTSAFELLRMDERIRWLAFRAGPIPRDMLLSKSMYLAVGGMRDKAKPYEDWDLKIRLTGKGYVWRHSGVIGVVYRRRPGGLSDMRQLETTLHQTFVLLLNRGVVTRYIGNSDYLQSLAKPYKRWVPSSVVRLRRLCKNSRSSNSRQR